MLATPVWSQRRGASPRPLTACEREGEVSQSSTHLAQWARRPWRGMPAAESAGLAQGEIRSDHSIKCLDGNSSCCMILGHRNKRDLRVNAGRTSLGSPLLRPPQGPQARQRCHERPPAPALRRSVRCGMRNPGGSTGGVGTRSAYVQPVVVS